MPARAAWLIVLGLVVASCSGDASTTSGPTTETTAASVTTASSSAETSSTEQPPDTAADTTAATSGTAQQEDCLLLTVDELDEATGLSFQEGALDEAMSQDAQSVCNWYTAEGSPYALAQVLIVTYSESYALNKDTAAEVFTLVDVDIPGADEAYATEEGSLVGMNVGGTYIQVSYIPSEPGNVLDVTAHLAELALARRG